MYDVFDLGIIGAFKCDGSNLTRVFIRTPMGYACTLYSEFIAPSWEFGTFTVLV